MSEIDELLEASPQATPAPGSTDWVPVWNMGQPSPITGAMQVIQDVVLGAAAASVDFTNIPQGFAHLRVVYQGRGDANQVNALMGIRFNGDAGANYDYQRLENTSASAAGAVEVIGATLGACGIIAAGTAVALHAGGAGIDIPHYTGPWMKNWIAAGNLSTTQASGGQNSSVHTGKWRNAAAINRVTLLPAQGNFLAGTRVTLYGVGATNLGPPAGSPSTPVVLFDQTLASPNATFAIDGIPSGYRTIEIEAALIPGGTDRTYIDVTLRLHPNAGQFIYGAVGASGQGGAAGAQQSTAALLLGRMLRWSSDGVSPWYFANIKLMENYDQAARHGLFYDVIARQDVNGNNTDVTYLRGGALWRQQTPFAAITGFDFGASVQSFDTGSRIVVKGCP